jgi:hypothetical protein
LVNNLGFNLLVIIFEFKFSFSLVILLV